MPVKITSHHPPIEEHKPGYHNRTSTPLNLQQRSHCFSGIIYIYPSVLYSKAVRFTSSCVWRLVSLYRTEGSASLITISRAIINSSCILGLKITERKNNHFMGKLKVNKFQQLQMASVTIKYRCLTQK